MKKMMGIVAAILILAGGAVAAMKWLAIGPFEVVESIEEEKEPKAEPVLIDMDPLILQLILEDQIAGTIQIQIKLKTAGQENVIFLKRRLPKVSDAFLQDLHSFVPRLLEKKDRLDTIILRDRLKVIGERLLGKGYIDEVQVQSVTEKPVR